MQRISSFQIWATLTVMTIPIAFLEVPKRQLEALGNNAWIAVLLALPFGLLIYAMYMFIIHRSQTPFPAMLEEHFGAVAGRLLQIFYFVMELYAAWHPLQGFCGNQCSPEHPAYSDFDGGVLACRRTN